MNLNLIRLFGLLCVATFMTSSLLAQPIDGDELNTVTAGAILTPLRDIIFPAKGKLYMQHGQVFRKPSDMLSNDYYGPYCRFLLSDYSRERVWQSGQTLEIMAVEEGYQGIIILHINNSVIQKISCGGLRSRDLEAGVRETPTIGDFKEVTRGLLEIQFPKPESITDEPKEPLTSSGSIQSRAHQKSVSGATSIHPYEKNNSSIHFEGLRMGEQSTLSDPEPRPALARD